MIISNSQICKHILYNTIEYHSKTSIYMGLSFPWINRKLENFRMNVTGKYDDCLS